jgi:hypothetical protein
MEDFEAEIENRRPKPERMEETLEGGRGQPRAVAPLEREATNILYINTPITCDFKCIHTIYISMECNAR